MSSHSIQSVEIQGGEIRLDQFLKWAGAASTGGEAKILILSGEVRIDGETDLRRGRKVRPGNLVEVTGRGRYRCA